MPSQACCGEYVLPTLRDGVKVSLSILILFLDEFALTLINVEKFIAKSVNTNKAHVH